MSEEFAGVDAENGVYDVPALDVTDLYTAARDFANPEVLENMTKLDDLVMLFLGKCKVPVASPGPVLFMRDGILIMKGLLFSPQITAAFAAIGPAVRLVGPTKGNFLTEVHVDIAFFEMIMSGETGEIRHGVIADVEKVIEA